MDRLKIPVHIIAGDHDRKSGTLDLFRKYLEPDLYRAVDLRGFRLLVLNALASLGPNENVTKGPGPSWR